MSGRGIQPEEAIGVSFIPHLHPIGIDRCHVLDLVLDQTGSHSGQNYAGSYFATYPGYKQRCSIDEQKLTDDNGKPLRSTVGQLRLIYSILLTATQSTQSQRSLPPVSYVKAIDVWMSSCTLFVFNSLMEFALVNSFMNNQAPPKLPEDTSSDDLNSPVSEIVSLSSANQANKDDCSKRAI